MARRDAAQMIFGLLEPMASQAAKEISRLKEMGVAAPLAAVLVFEKDMTEDEDQRGITFKK